MAKNERHRQLKRQRETREWIEKLSPEDRTRLNIPRNRTDKGERGTWRNYQGEKVYHFKGTFQEVWKEYLKLNEQLKTK